MSDANPGHAPEQLTGRGAQIVRTRQHDLRQLPDPSETWLLKDVPLPGARASQLRQAGVIEIVGQEDYPRNSKTRYRYRLDPAAADALDRIEEPETPCGHTGVRNLRDGQFTCTRDDCDVEFGREVAEREARR